MSNKSKLIESMENTGIIPLFSHDDPAVAREIVATACKGGVRIIEFTNRKKNAFEVFTELVKNRNAYPDMLLGIGTVMDAPTTKRFIEAGADFIISPILKPEMAEVCRQHAIPWIPGCATLTEIVNARDLGAEVIKVFPGSVLGPGFISSIMPVVPDLKLMITGGVELSEENLTAWFRAGSLCVGLGSNLFTKDIINDRAWDQLQLKISEAISIVRGIKKDLNRSIF